MMGIDVDLLQWSINFLLKKTSGGTVKNDNIWHAELSEELHKAILRKFEKRKVHSRFIDNVCGADLADMQLINRFNKRFTFSSRIIDIFSKYAWVILLKDSKGITIANAFQKILKESNQNIDWKNMGR